MEGLQFIISHTGLWIDVKSIVAFVFLVAVIIFFVVRYRSVRKAEKELEREMKEAGIPIPGVDGPTE